MDVSCPRCQTEYDFDEARIPDDGITVKCTECGHVFRVKRRVEGELPPPPVAREWKIRRRSTGTTSACRELTSLQQWIVEGKVVRDDEISLTGDTWKRLGDIPELASFFQVVDDAAKGRAYEGIRTKSQGVSVLPPPPPAPSAPAGQSSITETWREPNFQAILPAPTTVPGASSDKDKNDPFRGGFLPDQSLGPQPLSQDVRSARRRLPVADEAELERAIKGTSSRWPVLMVIGLLIGVGAGWFFGIYQPDQDRKAPEEAARALAARDPVVVMPPDPIVVALVDAGLDVVDAGVVEAVVSAPPIPVDAGPAAVVAVEPSKPAKAEPKMDFDALQKRGESLLAQDKPEAALSAFGRASDLRPDRVEPMVGRGLALLDLGNAAAAEAAFEQAIKVNPRYGPGIMGLAEALRTQNKYEKAIEWYQRYLDVMPEGTEANVARNNIERLKK